MKKHGLFAIEHLQESLMEKMWVAHPATVDLMRSHLFLVFFSMDCDFLKLCDDIFVISFSILRTWNF